MSNESPHARAFDLPGWPCPPRLRDIPHHEESWGLIPVIPYDWGVVAQDEIGYLWADGAAVPVFKIPSEADENPGAVVCWTKHGLGIWVHPKSLQYLRAISRLDMEQARWVPIAVALPELPPFVKIGS